MKKAPTGSGWRRGLVAKGMSDEQIDVLEGCLEHEREDRIPHAVELTKLIRSTFTLVESYKKFSSVLRETVSKIDEITSLKIQIVLRGKVGLLTAQAADVLVSMDQAYSSFELFLSLSTEAAGILARWEGSNLSLCGLESLTSETAAALANWKGRKISLSGLKSLTPEAAAALANWNGDKLSLDYLESLTSETAAALAGWEGSELSLDGLTSLTPETAAALASWNGMKLNLRHLSSLPPKSAEALAHWKGAKINFRLSSEQIKALLDQRSASDDSLLHIAAYHGGYAMAAFLIESKAEVDVANKKGRRPLFFAIKESHEEIAELLIDNGADVNQTCTEEKDTPLHLAAKNGNADIVELLLQAGADRAAKNTRGETALNCAVESGNIDTIRLLVPKS